MLGILDRYIFSNVILGSVVVWLVLGAIDSFFLFLGEVDEIGRGSYGYLQVFLYIVYTLPRRLYQYAPTAVLLGSLVTLGAMAARSELIAIRAAGVSVLRFAGSVMKAGVLIVLVTFALGEWVAPQTEQAAVKMRSQALSQRLALNSDSGLWVRDGDRFIHAKGALSEEQLMGVSIYQFEAQTLERVTRARTATVSSGGGWDLFDVTRTRWDEGRIEREALPSVHEAKLVDRNLFDVLRVSPEEMSASALYRYILYQKQNGLDSAQYQLAFWNRFMTPLSTLVMLVLAIPFVFGSQRTGGAGQRVFIGIMIGLGYYLFSTLLNRLGLVYGLSPMMSSVGPLVLFLVPGVVMLRRV